MNVLRDVLNRAGIRTVLALIVMLAVTQRVVFAFETDQFNLPAKPLADIGDEVSAHVEKQLRKAVGDINAEIVGSERCVAGTTSKNERKKCGRLAAVRARIEYLRSDDAVAERVYKSLGSGGPLFTRTDWWLETHKFSAKPARHRPAPWKSIFSVWPTSGLMRASTVNLYGAQFGTDKMAHLFQQGYDYYQIVKRALGEGKTIAEAERTAITWGQKSERTFFGTNVTGVYSNADLCANFVGLRFYQGLTRELTIAGDVRPPLVSLKNGVWAIIESPTLRETLLKPFVSDHFNEALNPSVYTSALGLRSLVRQTLSNRDCARWRALEPPVSGAGLDRIARSLELWHGEEYGFTPSENFVTVANTCFAAETPDKRQS